LVLSTLMREVTFNQLLSLIECGELPQSMRHQQQQPTAVTDAIDADRNMHLALDNEVITSFLHSRLQQVHDAIENPSSLLVTGATGFLGQYLVRELLAQLGPDCRITCIVRGASDHDAEQRLKSMLLEHGVIGREHGSNDKLARITVVAGSIEQEHFGLSAAVYHKLCASVQAVIHCAAHVNSLLPYTRLRDSNVVGTVKVLEFCTSTVLKPLHFISTIGVHGAVAELESVALQESRLASLNGYSQSKWVAEWLVTRAGTMGVPITIFRPAMICGDSLTGFVNADDFFNRLLRGFVELGSYINDASTVYDVTPVDFVAYAVVYISRQLASQAKVFHFSNRHRSPTLQQLGQAVAANGYATIEPVTVQEFKARLERRANADTNTGASASSASALTTLLPYFEAGFNPDPGFISTAHTTAALQGSKFPQPPTIDSAFIGRLIARMVASNVLQQQQQ
jgi:thioester reductase-like protein